MSVVSEINMNSEGFIYINNNLKLSALKISILKKHEETSLLIYKQCQSCTNDRCLSEVHNKYQSYLHNKNMLEQ